LDDVALLFRTHKPKATTGSRDTEVRDEQRLCN